MKKKVFAILLMVCFAIHASSATCNNQSYFTVTVSGIGFGPRPVKRIPSKKTIINAIYNIDEKLLIISFLKNLGNGNIVINCDGYEIINEELTMNIGEYISYDLSQYNNGEYEICITTDDRQIYIGTFNQNSN